jgi:hypothetical protein
VNQSLHEDSESSSQESYILEINWKKASMDFNFQNYDQANMGWFIPIQLMKSEEVISHSMIDTIIPNP